MHDELVYRCIGFVFIIKINFANTIKITISSVKLYWKCVNQPLVIAYFAEKPYQMFFTFREKVFHSAKKKVKKKKSLTTFHLSLCKTFHVETFCYHYNNATTICFGWNLVQIVILLLAQLARWQIAMRVLEIIFQLYIQNELSSTKYGRKWAAVESEYFDISSGVQSQLSLSYFDMSENQPCIS